MRYCKIGGEKFPKDEADPTRIAPKSIAHAKTLMTNPLYLLNSVLWVYQTQSGEPYDSKSKPIMGSKTPDGHSRGSNGIRERSV